MHDKRKRPDHIGALSCFVNMVTPAFCFGPLAFGIVKKLFSNSLAFNKLIT